MNDVIFLAEHPGWSYADLMAAPDRVVAGMRLLHWKQMQELKKKLP